MPPRQTPSVPSLRAFLKQAPQRQAQLRANFRAQMNYLRAERPYLFPADYDRKVQQAKDKYAADIAALEQQCAATAEHLKREADYAKGAPGREENMARSLMTSQAWARIRPVLETQPSYLQLVARIRAFKDEASRRGDRATLDALRMELPSFFEAREPEDQRARRENAGKSFAEYDNTTRMLTQEATDAVMPLLSPEEQIVHGIEGEIARYNEAVLGNFNRLRMDLDAHGEAWQGVGLSGFEPKSYIPDGQTEAIPFDQQSHGKE